MIMLQGFIQGICHKILKYQDDVLAFQNVIKAFLTQYSFCTIRSCKASSKSISPNILMFGCVMISKLFKIDVAMLHDFAQ